MPTTFSSVRIWLSRATDTSSSSSIRSALKPAFTMARNVGFSFFRSAESRGHADAPMREEQLRRLPDCRGFLDQERSAAAWYRRRIGRRDLFGAFLERRV